MIVPPPGSIAVIFVSKRTEADDAGYAEAAAEMAVAVSAMPGYLGMHSARSEDGVGITISYWQDEAAVVSWRAHERHTEVRHQGRGDWYQWYEVIVATVGRCYDWTR